MPLRFLSLRVATLLASLMLAACGGGGSGDDSPATPQQPDFGAVLVSRVPAVGVAGNWGYQAPDGARYAIMGTAAGVMVIDLRDPAAPRVVDEIAGPTNTPSPGTYWREMRVYGHHAYVVAEQTSPRGGIMIIDLSGLPSSVRYVKSVTPHDGLLAAHTVDIDAARGLLYLQRATNLHAHQGASPSRARALHGTETGHPVGGPNDGSIEVWDLSADPENPRYVTTFNQNRSVHDMTAVGDRVYVAEGNASSYSVWNVADPQSPQFVVRWSVPGKFAHSIWPSGDGSFVVTTEEIPFGLPAQVWGLNGSAAPTRLSTFRSGSGTPHNVVMEGRMAYLSHYTEGAVAVDLTDPAAPRIVARVDTNPSTGSDLAGCWGVFKFPGERLMACSDIDFGYHLIRLTH